MDSPHNLSQKSPRIYSVLRFVGLLLTPICLYFFLSVALSSATYPSDVKYEIYGDLLAFGIIISPIILAIPLFKGRELASLEIWSVVAYSIIMICYSLLAIAFLAMMVLGALLG